MKITNHLKYRISEAAKILGISVHTLRMYEKESLIIPYKKSSSQRLYSDKDLDRIRCIRDAINKNKISIEGIKRLLSMIPCWAIINCPTEHAMKCLAIKESIKPCWEIKHENDVCSNLDCRECTVYNDYTNCDSIKSKIVEITFTRLSNKEEVTV